MSGIVKDLFKFLGCRYCCLNQTIDEWWIEEQDGATMAEFLVSCGLSFDRVVSPVAEATKNNPWLQRDLVEADRSALGAKLIVDRICKLADVESSAVADMYRAEFNLDEALALVLERL